MGLRRPDKRQRANERRREWRATVTKVRSTAADERRPIPGFEEYYEITRLGEVFSRRHGRFIKHKLGFGTGTYIEFTINGVKYQLNTRKTIAAAFVPSAPGA
jgi:NUMOD4 motif-containing protein